MSSRPSRPQKASGLQALGDIRKVLAEAAEQAAREAEAARIAAEKAEHERQLFARTVGPIMPLKPSARLRQEPHRVLPPPRPRQRERDEAAVMSDALSDELDVESLLETDDELSFRRDDVGPDVVKRLRKGVWAIESQLDLHGLRRDQAREAINQFLRRALLNRWRCVRIVHGKGHGSPGGTPILKDKVKRWLVQKEEVMAFVQARAIDGGNGALVVLLRT